MKTTYGILIGIMLVLSIGFTGYSAWKSYDVERAGQTVNVVDLRIVELDGHDYVVGTSCVPPNAHMSKNISQRGNGKSNVEANVGNTLIGSSSDICIVHHAGCRKCQTK